MADKGDNVKTIAEDLVVTKYKMAGEMVNRVLKSVSEKCVKGASVREICIYGDQLLVEETGKVYKKEKELTKGIAFPTCVSVNGCICHFSPLVTDPDYMLQDGDLAKIDMGAHIDGFIAVVAHTLVVGNKGEKIKGRKADVILAAHYASEAALRLIRPGNTNITVTENLQKIADCFKCKPIEGMLSHELQQFRIDGKKTIIQNPNEQQRKDQEKEEFDLHEVYGVDVLVSTGEGVAREMDTRTTIYKKTDAAYMLKLKASRAVYSEVEKKFGVMPFNLRHFDDANKAKMGITECVNHKLIEPFQVLYEKSGELVAHFKYTVLLMPSGNHKITGLPFDPNMYESEYKVESEELKNILTTSVSNKTAKKKKKKAEKEMIKNESKPEA